MMESHFKCDKCDLGVGHSSGVLCSYRLTAVTVNLKLKSHFDNVKTLNFTPV